MREIIFRGKRKDNRRWVEGDLTHNVYKIGDTCVGTYGSEIGMHQVYPDTVGQFTGLTDKNGKRIFEGDIIESGEYNAEDGYGEIIWDVDTARFAIIGDADNNLQSDFDNYYGHELEVIGNIYDNPELMGGDTVG